MGFCCAWPYDLPEFFPKENTVHVGTAMGPASLISITSPAAAPHCGKGRALTSSLLPPQQGAAAFFRKAGLCITQGFWANRDHGGGSDAWTGGCAKRLALSWRAPGWETAVGAAAGAKARPRNCLAPRLNSALWGSKTETGKTELLSKSSIQSKWEGYGDNK